MAMKPKGNTMRQFPATNAGDHMEGHGTPGQGMAPTIKRTAGQFVGVGEYAPLAESRPLSVNTKRGGEPPSHR